MRTTSSYKTNPSFIQKDKTLEYKRSGYDKVLIDFLSRKNSQFPTHSNWERMRILYLKHDRTHGEKWWESRYHNYEIPDYTNIYGTCNWDYMDNDPDWAMPVDRQNGANLGIWASSHDGFGLLVYDDCDRFKAKRVAKLSIYAPEYMPYIPNDYACMKTLWRLNAAKKKNLMEILKKPYDLSMADYTNWNKTLHWIDMDRGITACDANGKVISSFHDLPDDLPIPDYTQFSD